MRRQRLVSWISGRGRLRVLLLALVAIGSCGIALAFNGTHLLRGLEGSAVDARFSIRGTEKPPSNIVIVAIDDRSLHTLPYLYPYPRAVQAQLVNRIVAEHPKSVTFDIQFTEKSIFSANGRAVGLSAAQSDQLAMNDDVPLGDAIQNSNGKVILDTTDNDNQGRFELFGLDSNVALPAIGNPPVGQGTFVLDPGGVIRRMDYSVGRIKTLAVATAQVVTGKPVDPKKFDGTTWIDFAGPSGTYKTVSYIDALNGKTAPGFFRNKIVVIGSTASIIQDLHPTSTDSNMPGPEIQANAINTAIRGLPLKSFPGWVTVISIIILGAIVPLISVWLRPVAATAIAFAIAALFLVGEQLAFNDGKVGVIVYPLGALILGGVGSLAVQLVTGAYERELRSLSASIDRLIEQVSPGDTIGGYRVEELLGRGGMGVVYRATQLELERRVALKVIVPELAHDVLFRTRFKREALAAASVDHPNVVPVYEAGEDGGLLFLAMRLVEGTNLRRILQRDGRVSPADAGRVLAQVAGALAAAHRKGLVHRDVKPANVLIDSRHDGRAYLTDFGVTRRVDAQTAMTETGMFVGTIDYTAPEQLHGDHIDARADIYALGCVLYEVLTGRVPFERETDVAKMFAHVSAPVPSAHTLRPELPEEIDEVIRRAMAKDPQQRYGSADEFTQAMTHALSKADTTPDPHAAPTPGLEAADSSHTPDETNPVSP
jgi:CHASE2 domain-containing sensor protein/tRNA A-37 threonylcarbamoyl transferase component Bud32